MFAVSLGKQQVRTEEVPIERARPGIGTRYCDTYTQCRIGISAGCMHPHLHRLSSTGRLNTTRSRAIFKLVGSLKCEYESFIA